MPESVFAFDEDVILEALKRIYGKQFDIKYDIEHGLFREIWGTLNKAVDEGLKLSVLSGDHDSDFVQALRSNNAVFAAFKTHSMQNEIAGRLLDGEGNLKSFDEFRKDTQDIVDHQVNNWLRTEYDMAVIRAHHAADWQQFEREKDILPNLVWVRSTSITPGADHKIFWGLILPIDHPFWEEHRPGDRWGCKCGLQSTDEPATEDNIPEGVMADEPSTGLEGNPGVTGKIFSDDHPYISNARRGARGAVERLMEELGIDTTRQTEKVFKSGGILQVPRGFRQHSVEQRKNLKAYTELAKQHGEQYRLLTVKHIHGHKNPDALNLRTGYTSDMKNPQTANGKNAVQAAIKSAATQRVQEVYIYLDKEYDRASIYAGLKAALQHGRAREIKVIVLRYSDGELKRYNADKIRELLG